MTVTDYYRPTSVEEAVGLLERHGPELLVMAGGTVVMPLVNEGISLPARVMSLRAAGLDAIERTGDAVRYGAAATLTRVLATDPPAPLADAIRATGAWAVRNLATIGGNLFTPPPGGDVTTALLALDARVEATGPDGVRELPIAQFHTGFLETALRPDELVTAIVVPLRAGAAAFEKLGRKAANTPSVVTVAARAAFGADGRVAEARIALGAAGPHPFRASAAEDAVIGTTLDDGAIDAAARAAVDATDPIADAVASEWYRRRMAGVVVRRVLAALAASASDSRRGA